MPECIHVVVCECMDKALSLNAFMSCMQEALSLNAFILLCVGE